MKKPTDKPATTKAKTTEPNAGPVPMRHRNRLGAKDLQTNPNGVGKPGSKAGSGGRNAY